MKRSWWKHTGSCLLIRNYIFCLFSLKWDVSIFCFHVIPWPSRCLIIIRKRWLASMCCCWLTVNMTALKILNWFCFVFFLNQSFLLFLVVTCVGSCLGVCHQTMSHATCLNCVDVVKGWFVNHQWFRSRRWEKKKKQTFPWKSLSHLLRGNLNHLASHERNPFFFLPENKVLGRYRVSRLFFQLPIV